MPKTTRRFTKLCINHGIDIEEDRKEKAVRSSELLWGISYKRNPLNRLRGRVPYTNQDPRS